MWAVEGLGKKSHFSQETRGITAAAAAAAARLLCEEGEGCMPRDRLKGLVTQLVDMCGQEQCCVRDW